MSSSFQTVEWDICHDLSPTRFVSVSYVYALPWDIFCLGAPQVVARQYRHWGEGGMHQTIARTRREVGWALRKQWMQWVQWLKTTATRHAKGAPTRVKGYQTCWERRRVWLKMPTMRCVCEISYAGFEYLLWSWRVNNQSPPGQASPTYHTPYYNY